MSRASSNTIEPSTAPTFAPDSPSSSEDLAPHQQAPENKQLDKAPSGAGGPPPLTPEQCWIKASSRFISPFTSPRPASAVLPSLDSAESFLIDMDRLEARFCIRRQLAAMMRKPRTSTTTATTPSCAQESSAKSLERQAKKKLRPTTPSSSNQNGFHYDRDAHRVNRAMTRLRRDLTYNGMYLHATRHRKFIDCLHAIHKLCTTALHDPTCTDNLSSTSRTAVSPPSTLDPLCIIQDLHNTDISTLLTQEVQQEGDRPPAATASMEDTEATNVDALSIVDALEMTHRIAIVWDDAVRTDGLLAYTTIAFPYLYYILNKALHQTSWRNSVQHITEIPPTVWRALHLSTDAAWGRKRLSVLFPHATFTHGPTVEVRVFGAPFVLPAPRSNNNGGGGGGSNNTPLNLPQNINGDSRTRFTLMLRMDCSAGRYLPGQRVSVVFRHPDHQHLDESMNNVTQRPPDLSTIPILKRVVASCTRRQKRRCRRELRYANRGNENVGMAEMKSMTIGKDVPWMIMTNSIYASRFPQPWIFIRRLLTHRHEDTEVVDAAQKQRLYDARLYYNLRSPVPVGVGDARLLASVPVATRRMDPHGLTALLYLVASSLQCSDVLCGDNPFRTAKGMFAHLRRLVMHGSGTCATNGSTTHASQVLARAAQRIGYIVALRASSRRLPAASNNNNNNNNATKSLMTTRVNCLVDDVFRHYSSLLQHGMKRILLESPQFDSGACTARIGQRRLYLTRASADLSPKQRRSLLQVLPDNRVNTLTGTCATLARAHGSLPTDTLAALEGALLAECATDQQEVILAEVLERFYCVTTYDRQAVSPADLLETVEIYKMQLKALGYRRTLEESIEVYHQSIRAAVQDAQKLLRRRALQHQTRVRQQQQQQLLRRRQRRNSRHRTPKERQEKQQRLQRQDRAMAPLKDLNHHPGTRSLKELPTESYNLSDDDDDEEDDEQSSGADEYEDEGADGILGSKLPPSLRYSTVDASESSCARTEDSVLPPQQRVRVAERLVRQAKLAKFRATRRAVRLLEWGSYSTRVTRAHIHTKQRAVPVAPAPMGSRGYFQRFNRTLRQRCRSEKNLERRMKTVKPQALRDLDWYEKRLREEPNPLHHPRIHEERERWMYAHFDAMQLEEAFRCTNGSRHHPASVHRLMVLPTNRFYALNYQNNLVREYEQFILSLGEAESTVSSLGALLRLMREKYAQLQSAAIGYGLGQDGTEDLSPELVSRDGTVALGSVHSRSHNHIKAQVLESEQRTAVLLASLASEAAQNGGGNAGEETEDDNDRNAIDPPTQSIRTMLEAEGRAREHAERTGRMSRDVLNIDPTARERAENVLVDYTDSRVMMVMPHALLGDLHMAHWFTVLFADFVFRGGSDPTTTTSTPSETPTDDAWRKRKHRSVYTRQKIVSLLPESDSDGLFSAEEHPMFQELARFAVWAGDHVLVNGDPQLSAEEYATVMWAHARDTDHARQSSHFARYPAYMFVNPCDTTVPCYSNTNRFVLHAYPFPADRKDPSYVDEPIPKAVPTFHKKPPGMLGFGARIRADPTSFEYVDRRPACMEWPTSVPKHPAPPVKLPDIFECERFRGFTFSPEYIALRRMSLQALTRAGLTGVQIRALFARESYHRGLVGKLVTQSPLSNVRQKAAQFFSFPGSPAVKDKSVFARISNGKESTTLGMFHLKMHPSGERVFYSDWLITRLFFRGRRRWLVAGAKLIHNMLFFTKDDTGNAQHTSVSEDRIYPAEMRNAHCVTEGLPPTQPDFDYLRYLPLIIYKSFYSISGEAIAHYQARRAADQDKYAQPSSAPNTARMEAALKNLPPQTRSSSPSSSSKKRMKTTLTLTAEEIAENDRKRREHDEAVEALQVRQGYKPDPRVVRNVLREAAGLPVKEIRESDPLLDSEDEERDGGGGDGDELSYPQTPCAYPPSVDFLHGSDPRREGNAVLATARLKQDELTYGTDSEYFEAKPGHMEVVDPGARESEFELGNRDVWQHLVYAHSRPFECMANADPRCTRVRRDSCTLYSALYAFLNPSRDVHLLPLSVAQEVYQHYRTWFMAMGEHDYSPDTPVPRTERVEATRETVRHVLMDDFLSGRSDIDDNDVDDDNIATYKDRMLFELLELWFGRKRFIIHETRGRVTLPGPPVTEVRGVKFVVLPKRYYPCRSGRDNLRRHAPADHPLFDETNKWEPGHHFDIVPEETEHAAHGRSTYSEKPKDAESTIYVDPMNYGSVTCPCLLRCAANSQPTNTTTTTTNTDTLPFDASESESGNDGDSPSETKNGDDPYDTSHCTGYWTSSLFYRAAALSLPESIAKRVFLGMISIGTSQTSRHINLAQSHAGETTFFRRSEFAREQHRSTEELRTDPASRLPPGLYDKLQEPDYDAASFSGNNNNTQFNLVPQYDPQLLSLLREAYPRTEDFEANLPHHRVADAYLYTLRILEHMRRDPIHNVERATPRTLERQQQAMLGVNRVSELTAVRRAKMHRYPGLVYYENQRVVEQDVFCTSHSMDLHADLSGVPTHGDGMYQMSVPGTTSRGPYHYIGFYGAFAERYIIDPSTPGVRRELWKDGPVLGLSDIKSNSSNNNNIKNNASSNDAVQQKPLGWVTRFQHEHIDAFNELLHGKQPSLLDFLRTSRLQHNCVNSRRVLDCTQATPLYMDGHLGAVVYAERSLKLAASPVRFHTTAPTGASSCFGEEKRSASHETLATPASTFWKHMEARAPPPTPLNVLRMDRDFVASVTVHPTPYVFVSDVPALSDTADKERHTGSNE